jgi:hypothetical protein
MRNGVGATSAGRRRFIGPLRSKLMHAPINHDCAAKSGLNVDAVPWQRRGGRARSDCRNGRVDATQGEARYFSEGTFAECRPEAADPSSTLAADPCMHGTGPLSPPCPCVPSSPLGTGKAEEPRRVSFSPSIRVHTSPGSMSRKSAP